MLQILKKSFTAGIVTTDYPNIPPQVSVHARGKPEIDFAAWKDARPAASVCPTGAISFTDQAGIRTASLDLAKCIFCGLCAEADRAITMTTACELADHQRKALTVTAQYALN